MRIDYFIPAIGQPELLDECLSKLRANQQHGDTEIHVIDNGSQIPLVNDKAKIWRQEQNLGMIESLVFSKQHSNAEILIYAHSDFLIHEFGWDSRVVQAFIKDPKLGLLGTVGGTVAAANGGRENVFCSFRDGFVHGHQTPSGVHPAVMLDGCWMAFRRAALDRAKIPDVSYKFHHFYDRDWCIAIAADHWRTGVISLDCEHLGGRTSCQSECQEDFARHGGEQKIYNENEALYLAKWAHLLPISVDRNWRVHFHKRLIA